MATEGAGLRPIARPGVIAYPLDDDVVLYDEGSREGFILNSTAAQVWQLADGSRTASAVARVVADAHGIGYREAVADVREFMEQLEQAGLLIGRRKVRRGPGRE